jgi:malonyl-CoA O-methyltransferase
MSGSSEPDKRALRRSFEKAAQTYDQAAVLQREVCTRALEHLDLIRLEPATILDAGCGTGFATQALHRRFPRATLVALDIARAMLQEARAGTTGWRKWLRSSHDLFVCGDHEQLPLRNECVDLLWSNLAFQWANELRAVFAETRRVLRPGGLLIFTTFGPDTLKELRAAAAADGNIHVNRFIDMHDIGDMMIGAGLADPVMEMEYLTLTYRDVRDLMRELKAIGAHNVAAGRTRSLSGKRFLREIEQRYEPFREDGRLPATFEIIYGHAWKPSPRVGPGGRPVIDLRAV